MLQHQTQETRQREVVFHSPELRALGEKVKLCKLIVKRPKKDWGQGWGRECSQFNQETKNCARMTDKTVIQMCENSRVEKLKPSVICS